MPSRVVESIDTYQRDHRWLGFPLAVAYKFGDDQGPYLTALITYYGFLSGTPLPSTDVAVRLFDPATRFRWTSPPGGMLDLSVLLVTRPGRSL